MNTPHLHRRGFIRQSGCAALTSIPVLNTILNLTMAGRAAAQAAPPDGRRKALVCIFLSGGCDTYNMLVPRDTERHRFIAGIITEKGILRAPYTESLKSAFAQGGMAELQESRK